MLLKGKDRFCFCVTGRNETYLIVFRRERQHCHAPYDAGAGDVG